MNYDNSYFEKFLKISFIFHCLMHFVIFFVQGGQSTRDEMCFNFIMYYPRLNLTTCVSDDLGGKNFSNTYAKG